MRCKTRLERRKHSEQSLEWCSQKPWAKHKQERQKPIQRELADYWKLLQYTEEKSTGTLLLLRCIRLSLPPSFTYLHGWTRLERRANCGEVVTRNGFRERVARRYLWSRGPDPWSRRCFCWRGSDRIRSDIICWGPRNSFDQILESYTIAVLDDAEKARLASVYPKKDLAKHLWDQGRQISWVGGCAHIRMVFGVEPDLVEGIVFPHAIV